MVYIADLNYKFFDSLLYLNEYYGVTRDPSTKDFIIIMKYYKSDLRNYITKNFYNIEWNKKLKILAYIAEGLGHLHRQKIIHRDLHSKNILCENEDDVVISDLGISKSAMESSNDNECFGIISYMAPEIWRGKKYTTASDIYSFGMIMWELMTGRRPFWDHKDDHDLMVGIVGGLRPPIVTNAPKGYIKLMQKCWHSDPDERPSANDMYEKMTDIERNEHENPTQIIKSSDIGPMKTKSIYISRPLSEMTKSTKFTSFKNSNTISEINSE